jgi:hypothetical protein
LHPGAFAAKLCSGVTPVADCNAQRQGPRRARRSNARNDGLMGIPQASVYRKGRRFKLGKARIPASYDAFIAGFEEAFGFRPLRLGFGHIPPRNGRRPRLEVCCELIQQSEGFLDGNPPFGNIDAVKQARVAALVATSIRPFALLRAFGLRDYLKRATLQDRLHVYFNDFERTAEWAAHSQVTRSEIRGFESTLALGDAFWCTSRTSGAPVVFTHTEEQKAEAIASGLPVKWAEAYRELVAPHDEFGYVQARGITIHVDSKENLDRNYASSFFYYWK